ncbi:MAG: hypothetical protein J0I24_05950 [Thiomonas arsenitoxydans]|uniref:PilY1 beta-propeller domain-containing protein n=1 Tax=Thiomonas arsenitoxydans (strain DSM 22701 / CIP 110005 / 3As) TaxID=426114 RepID=A0A8I1MWY7_THIA3|nr:PilC/PilY family type IV pilus protein [Thiomonas arsenitoxydans]MBN8743833.1 hypothetical protein [Thiomonas arsenitoxydans]
MSPQAMPHRPPLWKKFVLLGVTWSLLTAPIAQAAVSIAQQPLTLSNNVPGNLVLTPSVEWPTIMSMANVGAFDTTKTYYGYFDPNKCYGYTIAGTSVPAFTGVNGGTKNYFAPASDATNRTCSKAWSGNYLNWAATQTIDVFRSTLTGGNRVVDTANLTILEKARHTGQTGTGALNISGASTVANNTPSSLSYFSTKLSGLGNRMYFISANSTSVNDKDGTSRSLRYLLDNPAVAQSKGAVEFDPSEGVKSGWVYSVNIDVQVCKSGMLEDNCVAYGSNAKPQGLIQKYASVFTYSVFGYLNISKVLQDGAALRAQQGFVGPNTYEPGATPTTNAQAEWSATDGTFIRNPQPTAASDTTSAYSADPAIQDSGVINYINKFGQMTTASDKSYDPVSEMYYAALRYLKHQGPVESYNSISNYPDGTAYKMTDGFPVVRTWTDPWKYSCQRSFILGIGDVNTHRDKNLPGNGNRNDEPAVPSEVSADTTVNVVTATQKVAALEGITINGMTADDSTGFSGRSNSAYIAGLAYDAHTVDLRSDLSGKQTVSTYWVDVMENQVLEGKAKNQYWLAAKYGGFSVPANYDPYANTTALPDASWWTNGQTLSTKDKRPDNFFTGGDAKTMKDSLEAAFSAIASENIGSTASLSTNSTQLNSGSRVYQASYKEGVWSGSLKAFNIDAATGAATTEAWDAALQLPAAGARTVYTLVGGSYVAFDGTHVNGKYGWTTDLVNYIRGDASKEIRNGGAYRNRTTALGDIINSQPIYVGKPEAGPYANATFTGSASFKTFAATQATRTPTIYVSANDGMLHGFNANTGVETFAFMPGAVLAASTNPSVLAQKSYGSGLNPHQYFNDGEITVADVYTGSPAAWRTVLVGTTGRGTTRTIYALDITDPASVKFLWEVAAGYLGQIIGKPIIAQTANGQWSVLVGNGMNSDSGTAELLQISLNDGTVSRHATNTATDNGLSTPAVWIDNLANGISTKAYAGDLQGNVWSFDLTSATSGGTLLFTAKDGSNKAQPITSPMFAAKDPDTGNLWLFFGTGRYLGQDDLANKDVQSWYGLNVSQASFPMVKNDLIKRSITSEIAGTAADPTATPPVAATLPARTVSVGAAGDMATKKGWYMNLLPPSNAAQGERMIVANQAYQNLLVGSTLIPDNADVCAPSGRGWIMAVNPFTGTNPTDIFFDRNGDRRFNDSDKVTMSDKTLIPIAGIGLTGLTGLSNFISTTLLANQNGTIFNTQVNPQVSNPGRVSWAELINP